MDVIETFFNILGFEYDDGERCDCDMYKECPARIRMEGGRMVRKNLGKCGKFVEQAKVAKDIVEAYNKQEVIKQQAIINKIQQRRK
jgi:hypothetical protein